jgi:hypothetical protein
MLNRETCKGDNIGPAFAQNRLQKMCCCNESVDGLSARAVCGVGLVRSDTGIVCSNPALGMDVCPRISVICCPV